MLEQTDLELCKHIAKVQGVKLVGDSLAIFRSHFYGIEQTETPYYNPVKDDALCNQLAFNYEVCVCHYTSSVFIQSDYTDKPHLSVAPFDGDDIASFRKAVLMVIFEVTKDA